MVDPSRITNATYETIDSVYAMVERRYIDAKAAYRLYASKRTGWNIKDATNQLNMVKRKKQELLDKKKLTVF